MKVSCIERNKGELILPLIYLAITTVISGGLYVMHLIHRVPTSKCQFKSITGYPCPTCGSTRCVQSLLEFDVISAFLFNPLVFIFGVFFVGWMLYGFYVLIQRKRIKLTFTDREGTYVRWGIAILFVLNWIYLIWAGI